MAITCIELILLILLAVINDIKAYKIKNTLILSFIAAGMATNLAMGGFPKLIYSVTGTTVPLILLFILYALKMLGAGDIKLFCAIGAILRAPALYFTPSYTPFYLEVSLHLQ